MSRSQSSFHGKNFTNFFDLTHDFPSIEVLPRVIGTFSLPYDPGFFAKYYATSQGTGIKTLFTVPDDEEWLVESISVVATAGTTPVVYSVYLGGIPKEFVVGNFDSQAHYLMYGGTGVSFIEHGMGLRVPSGVSFMAYLTCAAANATLVASVNFGRRKW